MWKRLCRSHGSDAVATTTPRGVDLCSLPASITSIAVFSPEVPFELYGRCVGTTHIDSAQPRHASRVAGGWGGILLARIASRGCLRHTPFGDTKLPKAEWRKQGKEGFRTLVVGKNFFLTFWVSFATLLGSVVRDTTCRGVTDIAMSLEMHAERRHEYPSHFKTGDSPTEEFSEVVEPCHSAVRHKEPYLFPAYGRDPSIGGWWFWHCDFCKSA
jgi:hypothetical protein